MIGASQYIEYKDKFIARTIAMIEKGSLMPMITVMGISKKDKSFNFIDLFIPNQVFDSCTIKRMYLNSIIPQIGETLLEDMSIDVVAFSSEAWIRLMEVPVGLNSKDAIPYDWEKLPIKKEMVVMLIESKGRSEPLFYNIVRSEMRVDKDGFGEKVDLVLDDDFRGGDIGGAFTGLYEKFVNG